MDKKKKKIKTIIALIISIPCLFCFYKGMSNLITYKKLYGQYDQLKTSLNSPIENSSVALKDGNSVVDALKTIDSISEFSMISELDKNSLDVVKTISIDDIPSVNNLVEVTMKSTNVVDSLKSLSDKMLVCSYINVDGNYITVRIYVGGDK